MSDLAPHMVTRIIAYGHLGDGNIHLNLTSRVFEQQVYDRYEYMQWKVQLVLLCRILRHIRKRNSHYVYHKTNLTSSKRKARI